MSIINCEICSRQIDLDLEDQYGLDDLIVCENCFEEGTDGE